MPAPALDTWPAPPRPSGTPSPREQVAAHAACLAVLAVEVIGALAMWAAIPAAWFWIGARVYDATGSVAADGGIVLLGLVATLFLAMAALARIDRLWVALRRRAGHDQDQGALSQVVVVAATLGLLLFALWFYVLSGDAFIIPFMPTQ